jgi:iron complex outermembrane receptor protein
MKIYVLTLVGASFLAITTAPSIAQNSSGTTAPGPSNELSDALSEIIVTARRKEELLIDVPETVDVVTAETVQKLNILNFQDMQSIVPGLTMNADPGGLNDTVSMRGVTYTIYSQDLLPTVALYLNDTSAKPQALFQSLYDVGQIEVLRGPQGTLHGEPAPSGAITMTTRRPDLSQFGGYVDVTGYSEDALHGPGAFDVQAAVNLPIIKDMLAVRLAGVSEDNHADLVRSVFSPQSPYSHIRSERATVTFQPTDAFSATVMYQHLEEGSRTFNQVIGSGSLGGTFAPPPPFPGLPFAYSAPAVVAPGYNGPTITPSERLSVDDDPNSSILKYDLVTAQLDGHLAGQHIAYTGNFANWSVRTNTAEDSGNLLPGSDYVSVGMLRISSQEHELRIMSEDRILGLFDYTVGARYTRQIGLPASTQQFAGFLPGAFGFGAAANPSVYNSTFAEDLNFGGSPPSAYERSVFCNGTVHLGEKTELSAGARWIDYGYATYSSYTLSLFGQNVPLYLFPNANLHNKSTIYDVSLSHHVADETMLYATTGTSWRPGTTVVGLQNATGDATLNSLINLHSEYSHSFELGVKSMFLEKRAEVNLAVYHQYFDGLIFQSLYAPYLTVTPIPGTPYTSTSISLNNFSTNANSVSNGVDLDGSFLVTPRWNVAGAFSYANGHVDNALTPCTPSGVSLTNPTVASFKAAVAALGEPNALVYECKNNQAISNAPSWNTTLRSEYSLPLAKALDGFVRGFATYYPRNPNAAQGYVAPSYAIANLYLGVRDPKSAWEGSFFVKNIGNRTVLLNRSPFQIQEQGGLNAVFGSPGYNSASSSGGQLVTAPMQIGVNLRYAFGSR